MNNLGYWKYLLLIADAVTEEYGDTLLECGTSIKMAKAVLKKMNKYLFFHPHDLSKSELKDGLRELIVKHMPELEPMELGGEGEKMEHLLASAKRQEKELASFVDELYKACGRKPKGL